MSRVLVWFSCGAASAYASKLAIEKYGKERVELVYCDVLNTEHPDNERFLKDVEQWLGKEVTRVKSSKYDSVDDVFEKTRYMAGIAGARCTVEMKKVPRFEYQQPDDIHIFGLTSDEKKRAERLENNNPELNLDFILVDNSVTKAECHAAIENAGIEQPLMYKLGFRNNNCIGCVKASSIQYWKKVRYHFPDVFWHRAEQSRRIGARLVKIKGERKFLDEIPEDDMALFDVYETTEEDISCGPDCKGGADGYES